MSSSRADFADEPPWNGCKNNLSSASPKKYAGQSESIDVPCGDSFLLECLSAEEYSYFIPDSNDLEDHYSFRGGINSRDNINVSFGPYYASCYPVHNWTDSSNLAMDLREDDMSALYNPIASIPEFPVQSIGIEEIRDSLLENYDIIPTRLISPATVIPDFLHGASGEMAYPATSGGTPCDLGALALRVIPDDYPSIESELTDTAAKITFEIESPAAARDMESRWQEPIPQYPAPEHDSLNKSKEGRKHIMPRTRDQEVDEIQQTDDTWRPHDVSGVLHDMSELNDRIRSWNKHQMDAIQESSMSDVP